MRARSAASSGRAVRTLSARSFMTASVGQSARPGKSHFAASQKNYGCEGELRKVQWTFRRPNAERPFFGREAKIVKLYSKLFRAITPKAAFPEPGQRRSGAAG